jgi:hypothetical protein
LDHARLQRRRFCISESKRKSHFHRFFLWAPLLFSARATCTRNLFRKAVKHILLGIG